MLSIHKSQILLVNPHENEHYDEEQQDLNIKFAFVTQTIPGTIRTLHNFVKCRDFLSDAIYWRNNSLTGKRVYGFSIKDTDFSFINSDLAIQTETEEQYNNLQTNFTTGVLRDFAQCYQTDKERTLYLRLRNFWDVNPTLISLVSLLIKLACAKVGSISEMVNNPNLPYKEKKYISTINPTVLIYMLESPDFLPQADLDWITDVSDWSTDQIHDFLGIVSMFSPYSPNSNLKEAYKKIKTKALSETANIKNPTNPDNDPLTSATMKFIISVNEMEQFQIAMDNLNNELKQEPPEEHPF